ncbi:hemolymph lipopolysaccharide-binding protein-like [Ischnura elegans]|uniref:hemolymph lipopolysaccharide-binding protein-like n=1 Tax=Ischnura elegans TaxID=197161 RepID=UPI001ED89235|nr:hemolymph lipopolysaccharide-binding protein-like [Ischnura elegans]
MAHRTSTVLASWALLVLNVGLALGQLPCTPDQLSGPPFNNQTVEFSMVGRKNQTGHWNTQFSMSSASPKMHHDWKVDVKHYTAEYGGVYTFQIKGILTVPPPRQKDYEEFLGIGYYKFHYKTKATFMEASAICNKEGGHLAILDSEEEANVIKTIYTRNTSEGGGQSFIGFYDPTKKRAWTTIFGDPQMQLKWVPNRADNIQHTCGAITQDGLLIAALCEDKLSFFCEYDYSWTNV